jgi:hypothetical protein
MKRQAGMKRIVLFLIMVFGFIKSEAQISFPKGNTIDTVIHVDVAYYETQIIFNTGKYKSSDYLYQKISDSIHPQWLVTSCFNGDCHNELEQSGKFISEFGINDTTCFIAFHVESHDINGKSKIRYKVINSKDTTDQAILSVDVTYVSTTGIKNFQAEKLQLKYYPNPASQVVHVTAKLATDFTVSIADITGKEVFQSAFANTYMASINISQLPKGIYFIRLKNGIYIYTEKLVIE